MTDESETQTNQDDCIEAFRTVCAVLMWIDEQEREGKTFPPQMDARLLKAADWIREQLDEPISTHKLVTSEVLYDDD